MTPYLDSALKGLSLHTEARTSFITYWLPSFLKHDYVVMRFVPQASYERAATLEILPRPDVVTRVFMVFKGIKTADVGLWRTAQKNASETIDIWRAIVGVEEQAKQDDSSLFRVIEWGGMEVTD